MKYLILAVLFFIVAGSTVDSYLWHRNSTTASCTVVFKADPTIDRYGYPHYYIEVRRNDNKEWSRSSVTGESYTCVKIGDPVQFTFDNDGYLIVHVILGVFGILAFIGVAAAMGGKKAE